MEDYLDLLKNQAFINLLHSKDEHVLYSNYVIKVNSRGKFQKRAVAITEAALYVLNKRIQFKRRVIWENMNKLTFSFLSNQIALISRECEFIFISSDADIVVERIKSSFLASCGRSIQEELVEDYDLREYVRSKKDAKKNLSYDSKLSKVKVFPEPSAVSSSNTTSLDLKFSLLQINEEVNLESFSILRVLGKGSFGKVYQVRKRSSGEIYAMKTLDKEKIFERDQVEHTLAERHILEEVKHPYLVSLRWAFQNDRKLFLILDYFGGGELFYHLKNSRRFDEDRAIFYAAEISLAIGYLHSLGIVYRDLKPENILLDDEGHVKITDFGLAKERILDNFSATTFCGTPEYMAPEIIQGKGHGRACDWWSLGTLIYEMLVGVPPFYHTNTELMYRRILCQRLVFPNWMSPIARDFLTKILDRDPTKRLGSANSDLEEIKTHPFFHGVDWNAFSEKKVPSPFIPNIKSKDDTSNFDSEFTDLPVELEDESDFVREEIKSYPNMNDFFNEFDFSPRQNT